ncbi:hypothetical protein, partial [Streptomyces abyssalis]
SQPADPVRELMHRHRELCERAVDPLEIAAALEAHGVTDRVAARFRHRDVFSLAEELFARVPRTEGRGPGPGTSGVPAARVGQACAAASPSPGSPAGVLLALLWVLPGVLAAAAVAVIASAGAGSGQEHGPGAVHAFAFAVGLGLACALVPAVWCARWFAVRARRSLEHSRSLAEFAAGTRPLLTAAAVLFTAALTGLQFASREIAALALARGGAAGAVLQAGATPAVTALGVLLFAALLLAMHGFRGTAAAGLVAACALQAAGASAGSGATGASAASVVAAACGCAALFLLGCAYRLLSGASAHRPRGSAAQPEPPGGEGIRGGPGSCGPCASRAPREPCERCETPHGTAT